MNSDDDQETLGEILWELADSRAKQADLAAGRADVVAARNIAELKAPPSAMEIGAPFRKADGLNAKQVEWVTFSKAPIWQHGYDDMDVDAFLDLVEEQLRARQKSAKRAMPGKSELAALFRRTPGVGRICFCASENVVASAAPSPRNTPGPGSGMRDTGVNVLERSDISQQQISGLRRFRGFPVVLAERHCRGEDASNKWRRQQWLQSPDQTFSRHQLANWPTPVKQEKS